MEARQLGEWMEGYLKGERPCLGLPPNMMESPSFGTLVKTSMDGPTGLVFGPAGAALGPAELAQKTPN
ncbi:hypothetical protein Tco_0541486 [Tanacetum coccineum]